MAYDEFTSKMVRKCSELEQALAEKDKGSIALKERIAYYDRWLSNGVYYTYDEFLERVLKPRQQLMEQAVRFAECLTDDCRCTPEEVNTSQECAFIRARLFLQSPEVQAWRKEREI